MRAVLIAAVIPLWLWLCPMMAQAVPSSVTSDPSICDALPFWPGCPH